MERNEDHCTGDVQGMDGGESIDILARFEDIEAEIQSTLQSAMFAEKDEEDELEVEELEGEEGEVEGEEDELEGEEVEVEGEEVEVEGEELEGEEGEVEGEEDELEGEEVEVEGEEVEGDELEGEEVEVEGDELEGEQVEVEGEQVEVEGDELEGDELEGEEVEVEVEGNGVRCSSTAFSIHPKLEVCGKERRDEKAVEEMGERLGYEAPGVAEPEERPPPLRTRYVMYTITMPPQYVRGHSAVPYPGSTVAP